MFECSACTLRCLRAIAGDVVAISRPHQRRLLTPQAPRRLQSTSVATTSSSQGEPYLNAAQLRHQRGEELKTQEFQNQHPSKQRALKKELEWLQDPIKLAEHVHYTLRCENPEKALDLCRIAASKMDIVVSWNHIVDWYMKRGKVNEALKVYNEMKKRAQFPDSYTYTLLLRGLVGNALKDIRNPAVRDDYVTKAVSIYNSISSPTSRVKKVILHTNATLKVCSYAHDMDAFWGIASQLPERGPAAPDHVTYSIILTAIRHDATRALTGLTPEQIAARKQQGLDQGRKIWQDVIRKWRAAEIMVDEELVAAMGRLLLISDRITDWDDVLSLVQQTMKIERLIPPVGHPDRNIAHIRGQQIEAPALSPGEQEDHDETKETPAAKAFQPVLPLPADKDKPKRPTSLAFAQPGNDILSVLIDACTRMRSPKTAVAYWDHLTTAPYDVKPDIDNFHSQLRLLHTSRASGRAAKLVKVDLAKAGIEPRNLTFRLAMEVCARDLKNHSVLEHATTIIDVMESTLPDLDIATLRKYLSLTLATDNGPGIVAVLDRFDSLIHNLRSRVLFGSDNPRYRTPEYHRAEKAEVLNLIKTVIGTMDTLMNRGLVDRKEYKHWHARRSQLTTFVGRADGSVKERGQGAGVMKLRPIYLSEEGGADETAIADEEGVSRIGVDRALTSGGPLVRRHGAAGGGAVMLGRPVRLRRHEEELMKFRKRNPVRKVMRKGEEVRWGERGGKRLVGAGRSAFADSPGELGM